MAARNLYVILGVPKGASAQQVKRAYYALAHRYHPDKHPDASDAVERFREASYAYAILSDRRRRKLYDRFGTWALHALPDSPRGEPGLTLMGNWRSLLGGLATELRHRVEALERRVAQQGRGEDESLTLNVSASLWLSGGTCALRVRREKPCDSCGGSGAKHPDDARCCLLCQGRGRWLLSIGPVEAEQPCPLCAGRGHTVLVACKPCAGKGSLWPYATLNVRIPALAPPHRALRWAGQGARPKRPHAPRGDLSVQLRVVSDDVFEVDGHDLHISWPLTPREAALGARVGLPLPQGEVTLEVPAGTQHGERIAVEQAGLPNESGSRGTLYACVAIEIPKVLADGERSSWEALPSSPPNPLAYPQRSQAMKRFHSLGR